MATTKAYVFMGLKLENVYLVWGGGGGRNWLLVVSEEIFYQGSLPGRGDFSRWSGNDEQIFG